MVFENIYSELHNDPLSKLSSEERFTLKLLMDPVLWAEHTLKDPDDPTKSLSLREYQKEILRHIPKSTMQDGKKVLVNRIKVLRLGRRAGKTVVLAAEALHKACTNHNFKILYIAPFEAQGQLFFNMMERMLTNSAIVPERFVRKPFICQFKNGSIITAHTANVRATRKGSSIRGAEGDHILLDEMDFGIDEVINEVVLPIYMGNNRATITAASTPSGRRGIFYQWCTEGNKLGIKSFHYPSWVSPRWTPESERIAKATMTRDQYIREIEANFGDAAEGVFRHQDLDKIMCDYQYNKLSYSNEWTYIMGIDWNETFGVCMVIVGRHKRTQQYKVFHHEIVPKQEFTQLEGIRKIIELHTQKYRCEWIYADKGFGSTQIELLHQYGNENTTTGLNRIVKGIDYAGTVTLYDPITNEPIDKPAKPFLVNNTQLVIESHGIQIPESEDVDTGLIGQMRNFRIKRFSVNNQPIYEGDNNDHSLNALMLALAGFTLEYNKPVKPDPTSHVEVIQNASTLLMTGGTLRRSAFGTDSESKFHDIVKRNTPNYRGHVEDGPQTQQLTSSEMRNLFRSKLRRKLGGGRSNI